VADMVSATTSSSTPVDSVNVPVAPSFASTPVASGSRSRMAYGVAPVPIVEPVRPVMVISSSRRNSISVFRVTVMLTSSPAAHSAILSARRRAVVVVWGRTAGGRGASDRAC
jgi:hypothetical protein